MKDKLKLQSKATVSHHDWIFEEIQELEKKSEEALLLVQRRQGSWIYQNKWDEARRLQSSGNSRRARKRLDLDLRQPFSLLNREDLRRWMITTKK